MDNGAVKGFPLSKYQKLHIHLALDDMFDSFDPVVPAKAWSIEFVPVVDEGATTYQKDLTVIREDLWERGHGLKDSRECWCDAMARREGKNPWYVVEVRMKPWLAGVEVWGGIKEQPSFKAEDSQSYMRKYGITDMYTDIQMNQLRAEQRREERFRERNHSQVEEDFEDLGGAGSREEESAQLEKGSLEQLERKELEKDPVEKVEDADSDDEDFVGLCSIS